MKTIPEVWIERRAWNQMSKNVRRSGDDETGGILLGRVLDSPRRMVIGHASGPGRNARCTPTSFQPDMEHYRKERERFPGLSYVGEWHKHPGNFSHWSQDDLIQARKILEEENREEIICPIWTEEDTKPKLHLYYLHRNFPHFLPLSFRLFQEEEKKTSSLNHVVVDEKTLHKFWRKRVRQKVVNGYFFREHGLVHVYNREEGNGKVLLVRSWKEDQELEIPHECEVVIVISKGKKVVKAYDASGFQEVRLSVISSSSSLVRNQTVLETEVLRNRHVAIVGLGSIGGDLAVELAKSGVGEFSLFDFDEVKAENLSRHVCDRRDIGFAKTTAVARKIQRIVPENKVHCHSWNINEKINETNDLCKNVDLILVATDTENSRHLANWIAHKNDIPVLFAGLLERAAGGRVWRVIPGQGGCYDCHSNLQQISRPSKVAYSSTETPDDLEIQPGLGNDISFVTHLAVRFAIDTLGVLPREHSLTYDLVFWFNYACPKWKSEDLNIYHVEKVSSNPECPICNSYEKRREKCFL